MWHAAWGGCSYDHWNSIFRHPSDQVQKPWPLCLERPVYKQGQNGKKRIRIAAIPRTPKVYLLLNNHPLLLRNPANPLRHDAKLLTVALCDGERHCWNPEATLARLLEQRQALEECSRLDSVLGFLIGPRFTGGLCLNTERDRSRPDIVVGGMVPAFNARFSHRV